MAKATLRMSSASKTAYLREEAPQAFMSFLLRELSKVWQEPLHQFLDVSQVCIAIVDSI